MADTAILRQHLIDPEIRIRCNTCRASCPVSAVTPNDANYVVGAGKCNHCMACIAPCPTGSIDKWRMVPRVRAYPVADQLGWERLPAELTAEELEAPGGAAPVPDASPAPGTVAAALAGSTHAPAIPAAYFGALPFPVLEGQSIGLLLPGQDAAGRPHHARQYPVASPRNGERPGYNNLSLTVKRVLQDPQGQPVRGVASNYLCDLQVGDTVQVIGPFGTSFLMPNHPRSSIVMICTGTGSAPMRP